MKVRIGKNIHFNWTVTYNDEVIDLSTHGVEVEITTPKRTKIIVTPDIDYNVLSFDYKGKTIGAHYLTCYVDRYTINETVCDLKEPFYLVEKSWMEEDEEPSELQTETINIDGNVTIGGGVTYTAGNGIDITDDTISVDTDVVATQTDLESKQDTLTAGANITITNNEISATDTVYTAGAGIDIVNNDTITIDANVVATKSDLDDKQDTLTAGTNITISANNEISATDTTYTAGKGIDITNDVISVITPEPEPDYATMPLTLDIYEDDTTFYYAAMSSSYTLYYSLNGGSWTELERSGVNSNTLTLNSGDSIALKMNRTTDYYGNNLQVQFKCNKTYGTKGNIMSMLYGDNFVGQTSLSTYLYAFINLFDGTSIVDAEKLLLPATTLEQFCYANMFNGCTSLTKAPELPATTLAQQCYGGMFNGCTSLVEAPELPATNLGGIKCYYNMFYGCTSLTKAPKLPATSLKISCYSGMFRGCTSLVEAPELPATTLVREVYQDMFRDCTSLTKAPELPATTLTSGCYYSMFSGCTSLIVTPKLPATIMKSNCYRAMFYGCTSLTVAPELPALTLSDSCYESMFENCTSLVEAPELPALQQWSKCYADMFQGCTSLNYVKCLIKEPSSMAAVGINWLNNVAATGTFIKNPEATWDIRNMDGVPIGWTLEYATPDTIIKEVNTSNLPVTSAAIKDYVDQHSGSSGGSSYTAGNGIDITNDTISVDTNVVATQADLADCLTKPSGSSSITDADYSTTTGYAKEGFNKTSTSTFNLPSACSYNTDHGTVSYPGQWGVLLVVLENATNNTGTQLFFCVAGSQAGTIWVRSSDQGTYTTWQKITTTT